MGGLGVKVQHFQLTLLVVITTLTLPCERDYCPIHDNGDIGNMQSPPLEPWSNAFSFNDSVYCVYRIDCLASSGQQSWFRQVTHVPRGHR